MESDYTEQELEQARILWINVFTTNAGIVEKELVAGWIKKFGYKKAKQIIYTFRELSFRKPRTMKEALDENGDIRPKEERSLPNEATQLELQDLMFKKNMQNIFEKYKWNDTKKKYILLPHAL